MFFTIFLNGALGLAMYIVLLYCIGDPNAAIASPTGYPFIEIFYNATQSNAGTTVMACIIIALIIFATFGFVASASRQLWAFARDKGVPFSDTIATVSIPSLDVSGYILGLNQLLRSTAASRFLFTPLP